MSLGDPWLVALGCSPEALGDGEGRGDTEEEDDGLDDFVREAEVDALRLGRGVKEEDTVVLGV